MQADEARELAKKIVQRLFGIPSAENVWRPHEIADLEFAAQHIEALLAHHALEARKAALEEAAQAIERWAAGWRSRIEAGQYDVHQMQAADIRRDEGMDLAAHIRSLAERASKGAGGDHV